MFNLECINWGTEVPGWIQGQNMETLENTNGAVTKIEVCVTHWRQNGAEVGCMALGREGRKEFYAHHS